MKYSPDWQPLELALEARMSNAVATVKTSFGLTTAINEITQSNRTLSKEDQISAKTVVLPNNVFGAYEALAPRLWPLQADAEVPIYIVPQAEVKLKIRSVVEQTLSGPTGTLATRRFDVTIQNADRPVNAIVTVDNRLRLVRFELPDAGFLVVRDDAASVAMRPELMRNPTDADVTIPANGFNLAATVTSPPVVAGRLRLPVVILVGGATPADRDLVVGGIPVFAQLARGLADQGDLVVRYDRRGAGQSGGRTETATLADYAEDILAVVRAVAKRDDVDKRHIVVAGYGDGAAAALLAAARGGEIDGVITIGGTGTRGADLILERQQRVLDRPEPAAGRPAGAHRAAAEDPGRGHRHGKLGRHPGRDEAAGGHAVVPQRAPVRSRRGHAEGQAADPDSSRGTGSEHSGQRGGPAGGAREGAEEGSRHRGLTDSRHHADAGRAEFENDQRRGRDRDRRVDQEAVNSRYMKVGVPRETFPGESRVALIPSAVAALKKAGLDVVVERDAGVKAGFTNAAYEHAGASIAARDDVFATADIVVQVRSVPAEPGRLRKGQAVIGFADPLGSPDAIEAIARAGRRRSRWSSCRASRARRAWMRSRRWPRSAATRPSSWRPITCRACSRC